jgi:NitT/TauT family transport system permease protein
MTVAIIGQILSVVMAFAIGITGRQSTWLGSFIKVAAYNFQASRINWKQKF